MKKYELIVENVVNAYILDKEENKIVALCSTKRPDLGFEKLKELVEKANEYDTLKETNLKLFNDMKKVMEVPHFVNQENVKLKLQNRELVESFKNVLEVIKPMVRDWKICPICSGTWHEHEKDCGLKNTFEKAIEKLKEVE